MISSPDFYIVKGIGVLSDGRIPRRVAIELFLTNQEVVLYCMPTEGNPHVFMESKQLSLTGKADSGEVIRADNLLCRRITYQYIELISNESVYVGV